MTMPDRTPFPGAVEALPPAFRDRDELWCRAIATQLQPWQIEAVTRQFNAIREKSDEQARRFSLEAEVGRAVLAMLPTYGNLTEQQALDRWTAYRFGQDVWTALRAARPREESEAIRNGRHRHE